MKEAGGHKGNFEGPPGVRDVPPRLPRGVFLRLVRRLLVNDRPLNRWLLWRRLERQDRSNRPPVYDDDVVRAVLIPASAVMMDHVDLIALQREGFEEDRGVVPDQLATPLMPHESLEDLAPLDSLQEYRLDLFPCCLDFLVGRGHLHLMIIQQLRWARDHSTLLSKGGQQTQYSQLLASSTRG